MKYAIGFMIASVLWLVFLLFAGEPTYRVYDCGMAAWHPDVPTEVKEECRNIVQRKSIGV